MNLLTAQLLEATNGILLPVLTFMVVWAAIHLFLEWRDHGSVRFVYRYRKGSVAFFVFLVGLIAFIFPAWMERHAANRGWNVVPFAEALVWLRIAGTSAATVGGLCWMRVTIQWEELPRKFWILLGAIAVAFGLGMTLDLDDLRQLGSLFN